MDGHGLQREDGDVGIFTRLREGRLGEAGFTLVEMMVVVVLVMGILVSTALLTYVGSRRRAQNRAAQSNLRNAIAAADTFLTDDDTYTGFTAAAVLIEPSLTWVDGADSTAVDTVCIHAATTGNVAVLNATVLRERPSASPRTWAPAVARTRATWPRLGTPLAPVPGKHPRIASRAWGRPPGRLSVILGSASSRPPAAQLHRANGRHR